MRTAWWGSGLNGGVIVSNASGQTSTGWTATFDFDGEIINIWNAAIQSHTGSTYVVENLDYNAAIASGTTTFFGFTARIPSNNATVTDLRVNLA